MPHNGTSDWVSTGGSTFVSDAVDCCTSVTSGAVSKVLKLIGLSCSAAGILDGRSSDGSDDEAGISVSGGKRGLMSCLFRLIRRLLSAFTIQYESGWVSRDSTLCPGKK